MGTFRPPYANRAILDTPWISPSSKKFSQSGQDIEPRHLIHERILPARSPQMTALEAPPPITGALLLAFPWGLP
jgi:hypothetical protein